MASFYNDDSIHGEYDELFDGTFLKYVASILDKTMNSRLSASVQFDTIKNTSFPDLSSSTRISLGDANAAILQEVEEERLREQNGLQRNELSMGGSTIISDSQSNQLSSDLGRQEIIEETTYQNDTLPTTLSSPSYAESNENTPVTMDSVSNDINQENQENQENPHRLDFKVIRTHRASTHGSPTITANPYSPNTSQDPPSPTFRDDIPKVVKTSLSPTPSVQEDIPHWKGTEQKHTLKSEDISYYAINHTTNPPTSFTHEEMNHALFNNSMINSLLVTQPTESNQTRSFNMPKKPISSRLIHYAQMNQVSQEEREETQQELNNPSEQHSGIYDENGEVPFSQLQSYYIVNVMVFSVVSSSSGM